MLETDDLGRNHGYFFSLSKIIEWDSTRYERRKKRIDYEKRTTTFDQCLLYKIVET